MRSHVPVAVLFAKPVKETPDISSWKNLHVFSKPTVAY
jgi:hypothetical protein